MMWDEICDWDIFADSYDRFNKDKLSKWWAFGYKYSTLFITKPKMLHPDDFPSLGLGTQTRLLGMAIQQSEKTNKRFFFL